MTATAIEGDLIEIRDGRIRLCGIDAPERAKRGLWRGQFVLPWEWREGKRSR